MNAIEQKLKERRDKADGQLRLALNALFTPLIQVANKQNQGSHHNWTRDIFVTAAVNQISVRATRGGRSGPSGSGGGAHRSL